MNKKINVVSINVTNSKHIIEANQIQSCYDTYYKSKPNTVLLQ